MKKVNETQLWDRVLKAVEVLPYRVELPLGMLSSMIFPDYDFQRLKYWNKILCKVIREHGGQVSKRNGRRFISIPRHILTSRKKRRSGGKKEPEHVLVSEAWRW
jgi:hypothetical protein